MKKLFAILIAGVLLLSLISCVDNKGNDGPNRDDYVGNETPKNDDGGIELPVVDVPLN